MLTYLLNLTLIWGILLLFYVFFLSKEKTVGMNRTYLWVAILAGILIPLIPNPFFNTTISSFEVLVPLQQIEDMSFVAGIESLNANEVIEYSSSFSWNWMTVIMGIWTLGALIQLFVLIKEFVQLSRLKNSGQLIAHSIADYYQSNQISTPFSFGGNIYIPNKPYEDKELQMILEHEKRHHQFKHSVDNVILSLLQMLFWFHPLVYMFKFQLKMTHEYQVDNTVLEEEKYNYGKLLLSMNQENFSNQLIHTFNYKPLQKRIIMMNRIKKSRPWKYVLALPLIAMSFVFMSANQELDMGVRDGNITKFRGNVLEWESIEKKQVFNIEGETIIHEYIDDKLIKCNNETIYYIDTLKHDVQTVKNFELVSNQIKSELLKFTEDPEWNLSALFLSNLAFDNNFNVVYYEIHTIEKKDKTEENKSEKIFDYKMNHYPELNKKIDEILMNRKLINPNNLKHDKPYALGQIKVFLKVGILVEEVE